MQQPSSASSGKIGSNWTKLGIGAVVLVVLASLLGPIVGHGLWEPFELELTDWGRRAAIHLLGAEQLALPGSNNEIPTVEEVGRGELPVHSTALSLALLGLHDWAVRLPFALWALLGVAATLLVCWRLSGRKSALWAGLVLATMPLYFAHARTALGDAATMASVALAFAGLALACFDEHLAKRTRVAAFVAGAGFAIAAFFCRGALVGLTLPWLSVGLAWSLSFQVREPRLDLGAVVGAISLLVGVGSAGLGLYALYNASPDDYFLALGAQIEPARKLPTHDTVVHYLGHGLFPYSAAIPLIIGLLMKAPAGDVEHKRRAGALRLSLLLMVALGVLVYGLMAPLTGPLPFGGVFALAALVALAAEELDRRKEGAPILAMGGAALLVILFKDFYDSPEYAFSAYVVGKVDYPEEFVARGKRYLLVAFLLSVMVFAWLSVERVGFIHSAMTWCRNRLAAAVPALRRLGPLRGVGVISSLAAGGLVLSLGYYPALAAQLSPAGMFDSYRSLAGPNEPLATIGSDPRNAVYFGGRPIENFRRESEALEWLVDEAGPRRWMVLKADKLPAMNSKYRERKSQRGGNLPVLATGGDSYLVSNQLREGEVNQNPLMDQVLDEAPQMHHSMDVVFDSKLRLLGWEVRDESGKPTDVVRVGKKYEFRLAYEVLGHITRDWETFIHIDGQDQRFNGDHETLGGAYPLRYWEQGDFILDKFEFKLDSSYPPGTYQAYFGLFSGKKRFKVSRGRHTDDRLLGGDLQVKR